MKGKSAILIIIIILLLAVLGLFLSIRKADAPQEKDVDFDLKTNQPGDQHAYIAPENSGNQLENKPSQPFFPGNVDKPENGDEPGYINKDAQINILVDEPQPDTTLSSPFTVSGEARVFENNVRVQVTNLSGDVLIDEFATAHAPDVGQFGPFEITLSYQFSATKEGYVEVFSESARDGSRENLVKIPVQFE